MKKILKGKHQKYSKIHAFFSLFHIELECLRKKYEDAQQMLEKTLKENEDIKKELDASKIDVLAYKIDNETLLKEKLDLEADLKSFREDLGSEIFSEFCLFTYAFILFLL